MKIIWMYVDDRLEVVGRHCRKMRGRLLTAVVV